MMRRDVPYKLAQIRHSLNNSPDKQKQSSRSAHQPIQSVHNYGLACFINQEPSIVKVRTYKKGKDKLLWKPTPGYSFHPYFFKSSNFCRNRAILHRNRRRGSQSLGEENLTSNESIVVQHEHFERRTIQLKLNKPNADGIITID